MKEYKNRIEEIKNLYKRYEDAKKEAYAIEYSIEQSEEILSLLNESKHCRKLATKKLEKLAGDLGFALLKDVRKHDNDIFSALIAIEQRINAAIVALYDFDPRFNTNISIA